LLKLIVNFAIVGLFGLFVISQLYKHSSTSSSDENLPALSESKTESRVHKPIVLPFLVEDDYNYVEPSNSFFKQKHNVLQTKIDWHNHTFIAMERKRKGPGEQGKAFKLTDPEDIRRNNELNRVNGYWAVASDLISPNRSVADIRHKL
jgi:hypothetical protein